MFQTWFAWLRGGQAKLEPCTRWFSWFALSRTGDRASLGRRGERAAAEHLRRLGYTIVARQARVRLGEIDIVAVDGRTVVFVEVRTRTDQDHGHPAETVGDEKQRRVTRSALSYLKRHRLLDCATRFDVIAVTWPQESRRPQVEHYRDAFRAQGSDGMYS